MQWLKGIIWENSTLVLLALGAVLLVVWIADYSGYGCSGCRDSIPDVGGRCAFNQELVVLEGAPICQCKD